MSNVFSADLKSRIAEVYNTRPPLTPKINALIKVGIAKGVPINKKHRDILSFDAFRTKNGDEDKLRDWKEDLRNLMGELYKTETEKEGDLKHSSGNTNSKSAVKQKSFSSLDQIMQDANSDVPGKILGVLNVDTANLRFASARRPHYKIGIRRRLNRLSKKKNN